MCSLKELEMNVHEVMNQKIIAVRRSTTLAELIELFHNFHSFPLVPVVDEHNTLVGVVSFRQLIEAFRISSQDILKTVPFVDEHHMDIFDIDVTPEIGQLCLVDDLIQTKFVKINRDSPIEKAYQFMQLHRIDQLPVVDSEDKLVGMIGEFDILLSLFKEKGVIT
jgi:predicted transcriptional regulator